MSRTELKRPDPDELLRKLQAEEDFQQRGKLKVFLGYASGVGKSFRMLDEGRRRRERGQDVVVGAIQRKLNQETTELLRKLEVIPLVEVDGCPAMDVNRILQRRPQVCLVDGLAYNNPPGSARQNRWQDVETLLDAGISVLTSINLGYIAEHRAEVARLTGKDAKETIPESFIRGADEIVIVDAPADDCIYKEGVPQDLEERRKTLAELREIALVLAANVVDGQLENHLELNGITPNWGTQERIMVCLTPRANGAKMLESGRRIAERFHGELIAAHVRQDDADPEGRGALAAHLDMARGFGATIATLTGDDPMETLLDYARQKGITQIFVGHSMREDWRTKIFGSPLDRLLRTHRGMDVRVFPH